MEFLQSRQSTLERITPYKLCVCIALEEYRQLGTNVDDSIDQTSADKRSLIVALLKMIQVNSCAYATFVQSLRALCPCEFADSVLNLITCVADEGVNGLLDVLENLRGIFRNSDCPPVGNQLMKSSITGIWIRNIFATRNAMSFSEICTLTKQFREYVHNMTVPRITIDGLVYPFGQGPTVYSQTQINETEVEYAGKPLCIKGFLEQLSHHFPDLMEINFRKIINAAESQDPFAAITAIHDYFDWSVLASETGGLSTAATHAPLALAKLLKQHSSPEFVQSCILEAIRKNQEINNGGFLLLALLELYLDNEDSDEAEKQLAQLLKECPKQDMMALGVVANVVSLIKSSESGSIGEDEVENILTCLVELLQTGVEEVSHLSSDLVAVLSSMCLSHGHWELSALFAEKLLRFSTLSQGVFASAEPICIAACNLAYCEAAQGNFDVAGSYLSFCRTKFPSSTSPSSHWQLCQSAINFERFLHSGNFDVAGKFCSGVKSINPVEGKLRLCELLIASRSDLQQAVDIVESLRKDSHSKNSNISMRTLLAAGQVYAKIGNIGHSLGCYVEAMKLAKEYNRPVIKALAVTRLADIYVTKMDMATEALELLVTETAAFLWPPALCAERLVVKAKCMLAVSTSETASPKNNKLEALECLNAAVEIYKRIDASDCLKDLHYLRSLLYHSLNMTAERNKCALEFRLLDEHKPDTSISSLLL